ncbi:hypothetical protein [Viridibacillus arvi]|uniref:hypothetical protein n=1 Tax=Viridibacillus arvi TaxID=263475 RepID=UPI0034CE6A40
MLKRILIIAGILIVGVASLSLLNKPLEVDTSVSTKEKQEPLATKEEVLNITTLKRVSEKLHEKYEGFIVKMTSKKELVIQVEANIEYFNSVKKDMRSIAKIIIKSSTLKDYTVVVERLDLSIITEEVKNRPKELSQLTSTIMEGLKDYDIIENINTVYQKSITIHTSLKILDKDTYNLVLGIEEQVHEILHSKKLKSVSNIDSYEIKILNNKGKVIN